MTIEELEATLLLLGFRDVTEISGRTSGKELTRETSSAVIRISTMEWEKLDPTLRRKEPASIYISVFTPTNAAVHESDIPIGVSVPKIIDYCERYP